MTAMDAIGFGFAVGIPLGFLIWAMGFKGFFATLQLPPVIVLLFAVLTLNSNPVLTFVDSETVCPNIPLNSTATVDGNVTTTTYNASPCTVVSGSVDHPVGPEAMLIVNYSMLSGSVSVFYISMYRIFEGIDQKKKQTA